MLSGTTVAARRHPGAARESVVSRRGDVLVSQTQRRRMLTSAVAVISKHGYSEMSVARVTAGAGVSRRTFYDLFENREDCFLAAFDETAARARDAVLRGYRSEQAWEARVRAGLLELLLFLDSEPAVHSLLVVDALRAGPRVQERRVELLGELSAALHEAGSRAGNRDGLPALIGEGVVGAVLGVIHTRLLSRRPGRMVTLLNELMGVIVLPYLGLEAVRRELAHPALSGGRRPARVTRREQPGDPFSGLPIRVTHRTLLVLQAVDRAPGGSNREISDQAGVADQGQISRLLARLQSLGLIENSAAAAQPSGEPNQWRLTSEGRRLREALRTTSEQSSTDSGSIMPPGGAHPERTPRAK